MQPSKAANHGQHLLKGLHPRPPGMHAAPAARPQAARCTSSKASSSTLHPKPSKPSTLTILDQLHTRALADSGVGLLGLNAAARGKAAKRSCKRGSRTVGLPMLHWPRASLGGGTGTAAPCRSACCQNAADCGPCCMLPLPCRPSCNLCRRPAAGRAGGSGSGRIPPLQGAPAPRQRRSHLLQHDALGVGSAGEGLLPLGAQVRLLVVLVRPALVLAVQPQLAASSHTASLTCGAATCRSVLEGARGPWAAPAPLLGAVHACQGRPGAPEGPQAPRGAMLPTLHSPMARGGLLHYRGLLPKGPRSAAAHPKCAPCCAFLPGSACRRLAMQARPQRLQGLNWHG